MHVDPLIRFGSGPHPGISSSPRGGQKQNSRMAQEDPNARVSPDGGVSRGRSIACVFMSALTSATATWQTWPHGLFGAQTVPSGRTCPTAAIVLAGLKVISTQGTILKKRASEHSHGDRGSANEKIRRASVERRS